MQHIFHSDCRHVLAQAVWRDAFDSIVTDPPYGLGFMSKDWDHEVPGVEYWELMLGVAKPGAHLLAFGGTRKAHRLASAIEDAGWEIRDSIAWLYGQGYPKTKASLKPGHEPIAVARKPGGKGELNIDACRIEVLDQKGGASYANGTSREVGREHSGGIGFRPAAGDPNDGKGRWPANVVLDEEAAALLDEQTGILTSGAVTKTYERTADRSVALGVKGRNLDPSKVYADAGGASRFFYVAKASRSERTHGGAVVNQHPTVKPLALMRWLLRLVTPPGGLVLDPFVGSGTTPVACKLEGFDCIGIEQDAANVATALARLEHT